MTIVEEIQKWLDAIEENLQDKKKFEAGAMLLLRMNKNRYMYNFMLKTWKTAVSKQKLVYELKKHLTIKLSGVTLQQIEQMKPKVEAIGKELEAKKGSPIFKGKRKDHDRLPSEVQVIYKEVDNIRLKMRSLHEKLKMMRDAPPCDRHEYTLQLINLDKRYHELWQRYDEFVVTETVKEETYSAQAQTDVITVVSSCRSYISKNTKKLKALQGDPLRLSDYETLRKQMARRYEEAVKLGARFSEKYQNNLRELGVIE